MDEVLSIREGARRIHDLADVVHDKYELHRGLMDVMRSVSRENFHKRYIHSLAYLIQGIEFSLKAIQENLINNAKQRGKTLERSWFSRLISMFDNDETYYNELKDLIEQTRVVFEKIDDIEKNGVQFDLDPEKERTITNYLKQAQQHITLDKDLTSAEACYRAAANIAEIPDILIGLGNVRRLQCRFDEAEEYYKKSIETNPRDESAYLKLYSLAQERGDSDGVLKSLLELGNFYTKTGKLGQASHSYIQVLSKTNERKSASPTVALQKLGECVDKCAEADPPLFCSIYDQVSHSDWVLVLGNATSLPEITTKLRAKVKLNKTPSVQLFEDLSYAILQTYPVDAELSKMLNELTPHMPASDRKVADYPPLHYACYIGLRNLVRGLIHINYPDLANTAKCDQTPIQCATVGGHTEVVKLLIRKGAKVEKDVGSLPMAVTLDRREIFKLLIKAGASLVTADEQGRTPLHLASYMNRTEIVITILQTSPETVKVKDKTGKTALYLAALEGWVTITQLLLKSGANVNEFNDENWAPLHAAIMRNQIDCFMTLFSCGAWDVNLGKQNPFELAMDNLLLEASQLLVYFYPSFVINFLEADVAQDMPHRRFSMHATEALLSRARNYHLYGLAHHVQSERETTPQKWWGVALRCLEDAKIKIPPPETLKRVNSHEAFIFLDIGYLNFTNKRNKHALLAYKSSLETYATAQGYWRMGELFHAARDLPAAKENLTTAIKMAGPSSYVMYDQKDTDFCIRPVSDLLQFQKVAGFKVDLLAGYLLVNVHMLEEDNQAAEEVISKMREAVAMKPTAIGYYIMGCAYMDVHQEAKAVAAYVEALALRCSPSLSCALNFCLGFVHESTDQYDQAEVCYQEITKTDTTGDPQSKRSKRTDIGVILRLGQAQYFQGKRALALDTFKKITNDPYLSTLNQKIPLLDREQADHLDKGFRLADINHEIGLAYYYLGLLYRDYDYKEATEFLQQACKYHPHIALEALQQIRDDKVKKERDASPLLEEARGILKHRPGSTQITPSPSSSNILRPLSLLLSPSSSSSSNSNNSSNHTSSNPASPTSQTTPVASPPTSPTSSSSSSSSSTNSVILSGGGGGSYYRPSYVPPAPVTLTAAKSTLQKALRIHPQYSEACYLLGVCCMYESDMDNAVKHIQRSILMDPFYVDAYFDLANIYMRLCRLEDAVSYCEKALDNWRGFMHPFFSKDAAMCLLADIHIKQGNFKLAEDRYKEALRIQPDPTKLKFLENISNLLSMMVVPENSKINTLSLLYDKWMQCSPEWNRVRMSGKVPTLQDLEVVVTKGRKNTVVDEKIGDSAKQTQLLIQWKFYQLIPMTKSLLMGLHSLIIKCRDDRTLYAALDHNVRRACEFFLQDIYPPVHQYFIDKYVLAETDTTHDPQCFNNRVPLLLELRKTEQATYEKLLVYTAIISQESFMSLVKTQPHLMDPIQDASWAFNQLVRDSKLLWKGIKKSIPSLSKDMPDDIAVAKVIVAVCTTYEKHLPTYLETLQKIKEKTHTFDVVLKGLLQTWWSQHKTTEAETIKNKLQIQNINLVADQFNIAINALQFAPRRQLFTKQLLQAYVKTPRAAKQPNNNNNNNINNALLSAPLPLPPAPTPAVPKSRKIIKRREKKRDKKKAKEESVKRQENEFIGHLKTALRLVIEGNSRL